MTSLDDLEKINQKISDLENQRNALNQEIDAHKKSMEKQLKRIAESLDYTLVPRDKSKVTVGSGARKRTPARIKYCDEKGNTWTGRGMTPRWVREAESQGRSRDSFLV